MRSSAVIGKLPKFILWVIRYSLFQMSKNVREIESADEDTITCLLFSTTTGSDIEQWEELCKQLNFTIQSLTKQYIWQRDEFRVFVPIQDNAMGFRHLESSTCFGDNIEDEWYIVYLIFELTRLYHHLIVSVTDNDGDFLFIEAANYLPTWATPETSQNRIFIYKNQVHIIPPEAASLDCKLELQEAIKLIQLKPEITLASEKIAKSISERIGNPQKALENMHTAVVTLPSELATLLTMKPTLIAPIVNTYCQHDMVEAKYCKNISFVDCVTIKVTFTKFLYAMLMSSKVIPYIKHKAGEENKKAQIGLKLFCGYQILMNNSTKCDIFSTKGYNLFLNNLTRNGYFKQNIEGSQEYNYLLIKAKDYFSTVECPVSSYFSQNILQLMSSDSFLKAKESMKVNNTIKAENDDQGDNEDWMNIEPDQLNNILETRYGQKSKLGKNDIISSQAVTAELSTFLTQTSDFEGIETENNTSDNNIEFNSNEFVDCLEKMLKLISTGDNDGSEFSDYDSDESICESSNICDEELKSKLAEPTEDSANVFANIVKSVKEERSFNGPTSNLLRTIGVNKTDILDSDDDMM